jgi:hypothetical protein
VRKRSSRAPGGAPCYFDPEMPLDTGGFRRFRRLLAVAALVILAATVAFMHTNGWTYHKWSSRSRGGASGASPIRTDSSSGPGVALAASEAVRAWLGGVAASPARPGEAGSTSPELARASSPRP